MESEAKKMSQSFEQWRQGVKPDLTEHWTTKLLRTPVGHHQIVGRPSGLGFDVLNGRGENVGDFETYAEARVFALEDAIRELAFQAEEEIKLLCMEDHVSSLLESVIWSVGDDQLP